MSSNQSALPSLEGRTLCTGDALQVTSESTAATNGLTEDRRGSGPSVAILLHNASQLLTTSVNLPFSSPISICNA
uniref:Uncharacterized protein n=1 Tax=Rhizophora mucronata TaxID=61149 RepID=A0A2P2JK98_RHIMU